MKSTRRALLRGTFGAAIALPALSSLGWRRGMAQTAAPAKPKFFGYTQPLGVFPEQFWPITAGSKVHAFPTLPTNYWRTGTTQLVTSDFQLGPSLEPLAPHRSEAVIVEGIDNADGNHPSFASVFTGRTHGGTMDSEWGIGPSIDQALAGTIGKDTRFGVLNFAGNQNNGASSAAFSTNSWYDGPNKPAIPIQDPAVMFDRLFADLQTTPGAPNYLREQRKSILDAALGQATSVRSRLGKADQTKLDLYLESLRAVETKIATTLPPAMGCQKPAMRPTPLPKSGASALTHTNADIQLELIALAFACDLTRVVTFQFASEANSIKLAWIESHYDWHSLSHTGPASASDQVAFDKMVRNLQWLTKVTNDNIMRFARTISRIKEMGAWDGMVAFYTNPMSNGQVHTSNNMPIVLVGGSWFLKQNLYVRYADKDKHYNNDVLVTILNALGMNVTSFGDAEKNKGPLSLIMA